MHFEIDKHTPSQSPRVCTCTTRSKNVKFEPEIVVVPPRSWWAAYDSNHSVLGYAREAHVPKCVTVI
jgi:hypothetical protein